MAADARVPAGRDRLRYFDTLRLIGAATIAIYHFLQTREPSPAIRALLESGVNTGFVLIFFLISGFVIPFALVREVDPVEFFTRRAFRLLPLYFAALLVIAIGGATGLIAHWAYLSHARPGTWIANLLIVQDFVGARAFLGVSWTLALEMVWYVVFFIAFGRLGTRAGPILNILGALGLVALGMLSLAIERRIPLGRPAMIYACALGYQIYLYSKGDISREAMLAWVALFLGITTFSNYIAFGIFTHQRVVLGPVLIAWIGAPLLFVGVILSDGARRSPLLNAGLLPALGTMSYSLYLLHPIAIMIALQYFAPGWQPLMALLLIASFAAIGYYGVELPALRFGRRITRRRPPRPEALATR